MFNFINLYKRVEHYNLGTQFNYFQTYSTKIIYEKKSKSKSKFKLISANFRFRVEYKKVTSRAELS